MICVTLANRIWLDLNLMGMILDSWCSNFLSLSMSILMLQATAIEGQEASVNTDYILKVLSS